MHLPILVVAFLGFGFSFLRDGVALIAAEPGPPVPLPGVVRTLAGDFLAIDEWVVSDALTTMPASVQDQSQVSATAYLAALAQEKPTADLHLEHRDAQFIRIAAGRWLLARSHTSLVRRHSIEVIDDRPGPGLLSPPTAAPALGGNPVGVVAQPQACGLTLSVGSARVFCGVRSVARSQMVSGDDLQALAHAVHLPTASELLALVVTP